MKQRLSVNAPAKINLNLEIGKRRADGFHGIVSLFFMVDLYDRITISSLKTGNNCRISGSFDCSVEDNLVYRAWKVFCEKSGRIYPVEAEVQKSIPAGGGMGGGSSDAAAMLMLLNEMAGTGYGRGELAEMGEKLGSDVPFFFYGPAAAVEGRGEVVKSFMPGRCLDMVIVRPEISVSTPDAFRWLDQADAGRPYLGSADALARRFTDAGYGFEGLDNDFRLVLTDRFPVFGEIIDMLKECGCLYSNITGSGSVVFGVFEDGKTAGIAAEKLEKAFNFVRKIKSLDRIPYAILE